MTDQGERKKQVSVGCRQPNGVMIRVMMSESSDPLKSTLFSPAVRLTGPNVGVAAGTFDPTGAGKEYGATRVDAEFWRTWVAQNGGRNPLLDGGTVFLLDDEGKPTENPT